MSASQGGQHSWKSWKLLEMEYTPGKTPGKMKFSEKLLENSWNFFLTMFFQLLFIDSRIETNENRKYSNVREERQVLYLSGKRIKL